MTYKILLVPSQTDEVYYARHASTFTEALQISESREDSAKVFTFSHPSEVSAFLKGVRAMSGYRGEGLTYTEP